MLLRGLARDAIEVFDINLPYSLNMVQHSSHPKQIANLLDQRANLAFYLGHYDKAEIFIKAAIKGKKWVNKTITSSLYTDTGKTSNLHNSNIILGKIRWKQGYIYEALAAYLKALKYRTNQNQNQNSHYSTGRLWCLIGQVYLDLEDPEFALKVLNFSENLLQKDSYCAHHIYFGVTRIHLAKAVLLTLRKNYNLGKNKNVEEISKKIIQTEANLHKVKELFKKSINEPNSHRYLGALENAFALLETTKLRFNEFFPNASIAAVLEKHETECKLRRKTFGMNNTHPTLAIAYNRCAKAILASTKNRTSVHDLEKALTYVRNAQKELVDKSTKPRLFESFYVEAQVHRKIYLETKQINSILEGYKAIEQAVSIGESIYSYNERFNISQVYNFRLRQAYELALNILFYIWEQHSVKGLNGNISNNILAKMEGCSKVNRFFLETPKEKAPLANLPEFDNIKDILTSLILINANKSSISSNKNNLNKEVIIKVNKTVEAIKKHEKILRDGKKAEEKSAISQYSHRFNNRENGKTVRINDLWEHFDGLEKTGAILSYIITDKAVFVACVLSQKGKFDFYRYRSPNKAAQTIDQLKDATKGIKRIFNSDLDHRHEDYSYIPNGRKLINALKKKKLIINKNTIQFKGKTYDLTLNQQLFVYIAKLHEFLFKYVHQNVLTKNKVDRLYIIRDTPIHYLPFEILCETPDTSKVDFNSFGFQDVPFLVKSYKISYHLSISLLYDRHKEKKDKIVLSKTSSNYPILSLVSNYKIYSNGAHYEPITKLPMLAHLHQAFNELILPNKISILANKQINNRSFKAHLKNKNHPIVHLHMHTNDPKEALKKGLTFGLTFPSKNKNRLIIIPTKEIRDYNLGHIKLLLFVACRGGEGIIPSANDIPDSLVNAFVDAKVKNILYSSFRTGSLEAVNIIIPFLAYLLAGMNYVSALQQAKLSLINGQYNNFSDFNSFPHPLDWGRYTFIGNQLGGISR